MFEENTPVPSDTEDPNATQLTKPKRPNKTEIGQERIATT